MEGNVLRVGIIGSGSIVPEFAAGAGDAPGVRAEALCGRRQSEARVRALAAELGIPRVYFDQRELLADGGIDAVYVALPNALHYAAAKAALEAGKHAIVEKPFTANARQAEDLFATAERHGALVFEAIATPFMPTFQKARELLPRLGNVRVVQVNYSQYSRRYDDFRRGGLPAVFDPRMAGGALMDLGVYNIHFATMLLGEPRAARYSANVERGIDTSGVLVLDYPSAVCSLTAAKDCAAPCSLSVQGDEGCLHTDSPANILSHISFRPNGGAEEEFRLDGRARMAYELAAFRDAIASGGSGAYAACRRQTLTVMRILDEARAQAGIPVELG